ncbi:MAG: hypothetical protein ACREBI_00675 [Nitrosotalea sp.]
MSKEPIKDEHTKKHEQTKEPFQWTPETITSLIKALEPYAEKVIAVVSNYFTMKERERDQEIKLVETASKHDRKIIYVLLAFLGSVIGILSGLTYFGKVSGEALLFAVGGIVGYVFAIIQRFIFGTQRTTANPES